LLTVTDSTFSGNSAGTGGGIWHFATLVNTILSANSGGDCSTTNSGGGVITNGGYNVSDDASCVFGNSPDANRQTIGDNIDPKLVLGGPQSNGGSTQTIALQSTSPAIDVIPLANCPATDQG